MSAAQDITAAVPEERVAALKADPYTFEAQTEAEMTLAMRSPAYRISHLYKILIKGDGEDDSDPGLVATFVPNRAQRRLIASFWYRNIILKARQLGMCLDPSTRVLTADLRWVPIGDIQPGQEVVSVDEHPPGGRGKARKMRTATVEHAGRVMRHAYRVSLSDGREVICTDRHPWLTRKAATDAKWRSLSGEGNQVVGKITVGTKVRSITTPWGEPDYQDGWFGGMLDGEGSISNGNRAGCQLSVSQVVGPVWARAHRYLDERGYAYRIEEDEGLRESKHGSEAVPRLALTRMDDIFRLIGTTRPSRFIGRRFWEGRELPGKRGAGVAWVEVTGIEYIGEQEMVDLQTSTGTYIAEGLVSHNTTFIAIMFLDACLFRPNVRAGMIAQTDGIAKKLFRDKVKFAYDNLPDHVRRAMPLERESADELLFAHTGSSIQVSTSMRSGTLQYLHVSEFGKICADFPKRAQEVVTGSIPTVPANGVIFIESTAEGREGHFYNMTMRAKALQEQGTPLTRKDYKLHFFPWFEEPNYRAPAGTVLVTKRDHDYFDGLEAKLGVVIDDEQRSWYCATRDGDFSGDEEMMFQEYPSTPEEAFHQSTRGTYYAQQFTNARKQGRILPRLPLEPGVPCYTCWDIGNSDGTAIWVVQKIGNEWRLVDFYEAWGEPYSHAVQWLQARGLVWDTHYLPHDADHIRQGQNVNKSPKQMLEELMPGANFVTVPRIEDVNWGIQQTRDMFPLLWFDEEKTKAGIEHLELYRRKWNTQQGAWGNLPDKTGGHSEAADALRQLAQAYASGLINVNSAQRLKRRGSWRTV